MILFIALPRRTTAGSARATPNRGAFAAARSSSPLPRAALLSQNPNQRLRTIEKEADLPVRLDQLSCILNVGGATSPKERV